MVNKEFEALLIRNKIHERSAPYSPHQNGTVEGDGDQSLTWLDVFSRIKTSEINVGVCSIDLSSYQKSLL